MASRARAKTPAASGAAADVPECVLVHLPYKSVVACLIKLIRFDGAFFFYSTFFYCLGSLLGNAAFLIWDEMLGLILLGSIASATTRLIFYSLNIDGLKK